MLFTTALGELRGASTRETLATQAATWASLLAHIDSVKSLGSLLGIEISRHLDVTRWCATVRACNVLQTNGIAELSKITELSVRDIWELRNCGEQTVVDILTALLITAAEDESGPRPEIARPFAGILAELRTAPDLEARNEAATAW